MIHRFLPSLPPMSRGAKQSLCCAQVAHVAYVVHVAHVAHVALIAYGASCISTWRMSTIVLLLF